MWVFKLDLDSNDVWYFISDNFFGDIKVYNNFNNLLVALGFPRRSVVRVFWIIATLSFAYWYYDGPPAATRVEEATIVLVQGEVLTPLVPPQQGQAAEEGDTTSDDDDSDMPGLVLEEVPCQTPLREVPCQTPLQTLGSRIRNAALRNATRVQEGEVATIVPVQGGVVDDSGDDVPGLVETVPCQTPLQTLGSRLSNAALRNARLRNEGLEAQVAQHRTDLLSSRLKNAALTNAGLEAQVAQHRTERDQHRTERAQHMVLRQDVAALHAVHAHVHARHSIDIRETARMLFIIIFFFAVIFFSYVRRD
jgi:hypothetical protein